MTLEELNAHLAYLVTRRNLVSGRLAKEFQKEIDLAHRVREAVHNVSKRRA
jgi:hypothetical protein